MPIFFDLDAPQDLIDSLKARSSSFKAALDYVYSEGYREGFDAGCTHKFPEPVSQWPEPRSFDTDPPTFEDADPSGCVCVRVGTADWIGIPWERAHRTHPGHNLGWARSPQWVPQPKALRTEAESALEAFDHILKNASTNLGETSVRGALEKLRKLEQEGRSKA